MDIELSYKERNWIFLNKVMQKKESEKNFQGTFSPVKEKEICFTDMIRIDDISLQRRRINIDSSQEVLHRMQ